MRLRARLTLTYLAMVVFFLATFGASWLFFGGAELLVVMHKPLEGLGAAMAANTEKAFQEGGWPRAEQGLRWAVLSTRASMVLIRGDEILLLQGRPAAPDATLLQDAQTGQRVYYSRPEGGADLYLPLQTTPPAVLYLRLPGRGVEAHRGLLTSSLIKAGIFSGFMSLLLGIAASSIIAVPVRRLVSATQALAESDFQQPIQVGDQGELSELARSFNSMTRRLDESFTSLREAKEQAERSEASRRQFMAEVSHNLRTPLAAIQGWTEALLDNLVPHEETLHLRKIHRETLFVAQTVQRLLDWSRWEDTPPVLTPETFPISEPLLDSAETLAEAAEAKGIVLRFHGLEKEPWVVADRLRTREIFQLLLENAVHHNPSGTSIDVTFSADGARVWVKVADDGPGLPEEFRRDLRCRCGGGLGLAITSRLVEAHGGTLVLDPGPRTCLTFSLAQGLPA